MTNAVGVEARGGLQHFQRGRTVDVPVANGDDVLEEGEGLDGVLNDLSVEQQMINRPDRLETFGLVEQRNAERRRKVDPAP